MNFDSIGSIFVDDKYINVKEVYSLYNETYGKIIENNRKIWENSVKADEVNALRYIEDYIERRPHKYSNNVLEGIKILKKSKTKYLDSTLHKSTYERILFNWVNREVIKYPVPGYDLKLWIEDPFSEVIRMVTDFNEEGFQSIVVPRKIYLENKDYFDNKMKPKDKATIGDCYLGGKSHQIDHRFPV